MANKKKRMQKQTINKTATSPIKGKEKNNKGRQ